MKIKLLFTGILSLFILFGCEDKKNDESDNTNDVSIVGSWSLDKKTTIMDSDTTNVENFSYNTEVWTFNDGGSASFKDTEDTIIGTWSTTGSVLHISSNIDDGDEDYDFLISGDELTLTSTEIFTNGTVYQKVLEFTRIE